MRKFLGMSMLAAALAGALTQPAEAGCNFQFGFSFNYGFQYDGCWRPCGGHCCFSGCGHQPQYLVTFPEDAQQAAPHAQFPPSPQPERQGPKGERQQAETTAQWGYPNLNYSYYHPVNYYLPSSQGSYSPADAYYPQPYYYGPGYYQYSGTTFDR